MASFDPRTADRLNRYLDQRSGDGGVAGQQRDLPDSSLVRTIQRLQARDDAPTADPAFTDRLLEEIMATTAQPAAFLRDTATGPIRRNGRVNGGKFSIIALPWGTPRGHGILAGLATAALIALVLVSTLFVFGPGWMNRGRDTGAFIPAIEATPATPAAETAIAELVWETRGAPDEQFRSKPWVNTIDPEGNLWVLDGPRHQFQVFAPDGTFIRRWGTPGSRPGQFNFIVEAAGWPSGDISFDQDGTFYVSDPGNFRIQKFDAAGAFVTAWGSEGLEDGQFLWPGQVEVSDLGFVYVPDEFRNDIQIFDTDGNHLHTIAGRGSAEGQLNLSFGSSVAVDPAGNLVVVDSGNYRIQVFSPEGEFISAWGERGNEDGQFATMADVKVDDSGRVFVIDVGEVQIFSPNGAFLGSWSGVSDEYINLASIVLDGRGFAYVSDFGRNKIQKYRLLPPFGSE